MRDSAGAEWGRYFIKKREKDRKEDRKREELNKLGTEESLLERRATEIRRLLKYAPAPQVMELRVELKKIRSALEQLSEKRVRLDSQDSEPPIPAIYLFFGFDQRYSFFGQPGLILKVGRTRRTPHQRLNEMRTRDLKLFTFWEVDESNLSKCEALAIKLLRAEYGAPIEGNELFAIDDLDRVKEMLEFALSNYIAKPTKRA